MVTGTLAFLLMVNTLGAIDAPTAMLDPRTTTAGMSALELIL